MRAWLKRKRDQVLAWWRRTPAPATVVAERDDSAVAGSFYASDRPVQSAAQDRFARAAFARRIADTIATREDAAGIVLGLYGPWGDGKTSVLRMIEERLKDFDDCIVVPFNPWHFASEEPLLRGFFDTLAAAIGKKLTTRTEEIGKLMADFGLVLSVVNAGEATKGIGAKLSTVDLETMKGRVELMLPEEGKRVVVLIDDIDRLDRGETHLIFKLVKLSAGFERVAYLLAFDDEVVAAALGERFGDGRDGAGRAFLEKIVQVPLHLPAAEATALRKLAYEGIDRALQHAGIELSREQIDRFSIRFTSGLDESLRTPRQAHLYSNALLFALPLVKDEVNTVDFMLIEGLRIFHPKLHRTLRDSAALLLSARERDQDDRREAMRARIEASTPELEPVHRDRLISGVLSHLFPRLNGIYDEGWEAEWARDRRVCAQSYFHKYFAYGASLSQVSDRVVDEFLAALPEQSDEEQDAALQGIATADASASLVRRLRQREQRLAPDAAAALARTLARNGQRFIVERGPFVMGGTRSQAAILIMASLQRIENVADRLALAADVLRRATPLPFAGECLNWLGPTNEPPETWVFDAASFAWLRDLVVARVREADAENPIYRQFAKDGTMLYWYWHEHDADDVRALTTAHLDAGVDEVDFLLDAFVGESWELGSGMPTRSDLRRDSYNQVARLVDPAEIARRLRMRYGAELDQPVFHHGDDVEPTRRTAHQFMVVHQAVVAAEEQPHGAAPYGGE